MEKKSKGLIVAVVLLVLLVIGLALYICYDKGIIFSSNRNDSNEVANDEKNEADNGAEDEDIESELTDGYVIKDINKKVNAFLSIGQDSDNDTSIIWHGNTYRLSSSDYMNYSDNNKLFMVLNSNTHNFRTMSITEVENAKSIISNRSSEDIQSYCTVYEVAKINEDYRSFFGANASYSNTNILGNCPEYFYDSTNQVYYQCSGGCGGSSAISIGYIYRYGQKGDEVYAYLTLGTIAGDIYTDLYVYGQGDAPAKYDKALNNNTIDETNYTDFTKYKMTFKKGTDGIYYFSSFQKDS